MRRRESKADGAPGAYRPRCWLWPGSILMALEGLLLALLRHAAVPVWSPLAAAA
jgi:hypothetical protein